MYVLLEHKKRQVKVFQFLSRNAFIFPYVYHRSLLFVSSWAKMAKKQEYLYDSVLVIIKNSWFATLDKAAMLGVNTTGRRPTLDSIHQTDILLTLLFLTTNMAAVTSRVNQQYYNSLCQALR